jgi:hypothetical protein
MSIPTDRVYKHTRNIALERFAAAVTTGLFSTHSISKSSISELGDCRQALASVILDLAEALTDEYLRRADA